MSRAFGIFRVGRATLVAGMLLAGALMAPSAIAQSTYYWDANGATSGFGTASGTWGSNSFFSTNASGTVATSNLTTTTSDSLNFGTATTSFGLATGTIAVNGSQSIGSLVFGSVSGAITLSGGTISLADAGSVQVNNSAVTIGSVLGGAATSFTKSGTGGLTLTANNTYSGATSVVGLLMSATSRAGNVAGTGGPLRISGAAGRLANTSALTVTGATLINGDDTAANNSGITDRIASGITLTLGGVSGGGVYRQMAPAVGGTASQSFAALAVGPGLSTISGSGATGTNLLAFTGDAATAYARSVGSVVNIVPDAGFSVSFTNLPSQTAGTGTNRILAGATINSNDFVGFSGAGPYVTGTASYTNLSSGTWATAGGNLRLTGNSTLASGTAANSVLFAASGNTLTLSGTNVIGSGMVLGSSTATSATLSGGAITSGYTNSDGINELIVINRYGADNRTPFGLLVSSTIVNNGATPLSLTLSGSAPSQGGFGGVRLNANNTFTGTTTINGAAVYFSNDAAFGAVPATPQVNIRVTAAGGYLGAVATGTIAATRTIQLENGILGLDPQVQNAGFVLTIASKITGTGALFGPANRGGQVILTGTNDFVGYMDLSALNWRADDGVGLSPNANLRFTNGMIETTGTFVRPLGGGAGQVQWGGGYQSGGNYANGGFSAVNGALTVALGGTASPNLFSWASGGWVNPSGGIGYPGLYLQNTNATQPLTWVNPLDLANNIRIVQVSSTTQATLAEMTGAISGTGASSALQKTGAGVLRLSSTASTYSGSTSLAAGTLEFVSLANTGSPSSLGSGSSSGLIGVANATTLRYIGSGNSLSNRTVFMTGTTSGTATIEAAGAGPVGYGSLSAVSGTAIAMTLRLSGTSTADNSFGAIANPSSGTTSLLKQGAGRWVLTGSGNYTGSTTIEQGELVLAANALGSGSGALGSNGNAAVTIGSASGSGTAALFLKAGVEVNTRPFTIPGGTQATIIGAIDGSGTATFGSSGDTPITLGRNLTIQAATGGTLLFSNQWTQASGTSVNVTVGNVGNEGTVQLGQPLAATGTIRIDRGLLRLSMSATTAGSLAAASAVVVGPAGSANAILNVRDLTSSYAFGAAQSLSGIGTVQLDTDTPVSVAGFFSPGNSPGIFTFEGDGSSGVTTLSGTTFMEITGTTVGTSYDQVRFTSGATLNYGSGRLLLDVTGVYADNTQFQLFDFASTASGSFTTISGAGSYGLLTFVRGTSGVWTSGSTSQPNQTFEFRESTGTLVVVPEPATLALAAVGIGLAGWGAVRRRK